MKSKVVIVGPTGPVLDVTAFNLLYSFPTKAEAQAHASCLRTVGVKVSVLKQGLNLRIRPDLTA